MESPCYFSKMILAILADSIEADQGRGNIDSSCPLHLAIMIVVVVVVIGFGAWVKHKLPAWSGNSTRSSLDPEIETAESHK